MAIMAQFLLTDKQDLEKPIPSQVLQNAMRIEVLFQEPYNIFSQKPRKEIPILGEYAFRI